MVTFLLWMFLILILSCLLTLNLGKEMEVNGILSSRGQHLHFFCAFSNNISQ